MSKRIKKSIVKIILFIMFVFVAYLLIFSLNSEITFYKTIDEVYEDNFASKRNELSGGDKLLKDKIRVGGVVVINSLVREDELWKFDLQNDEGKKISVNYAGILPDLFSESVVILAEGHLKNQAEGILLEASQILTKHDENYQPKY